MLTYWVDTNTGLRYHNILNRGNERVKSTVIYLRQLPVCSSQATHTLLEEGVDLGLLYGGGHVHGVQRAGVVITPCTREGECNHRRLLPLGQEVQESEPHRAVLQGKNTMRDDNMKQEDCWIRKSRRRKDGNYLTSRSVVGSTFCTKRLGMFAGALLLGIDSCVIPEQQTQL